MSLLKNALRKILLVFFIAVFLVSSFMLVREITQRRKAVQYIQTVEKEYTPTVIKKPTPPEKPKESDPEIKIEEPEEPVYQENPTVKALCEKYPDVIGWLTCDAVNVSLPFVRGKDNSEYLRADLDKNYLVTGTLFLDYRNDRDMNDVVSVIYGHNMKNSTMFADLKKYRDQEFLEKNQDIYVSYPDYTAHYIVYAAMMVDAENCILYDCLKTGDITPEEVENYVNSSDAYVNASVTVSENSKFLVLSTCSPEFFYARTAVVCVLDSIY